MIINENFELKNGVINKEDGTSIKIAYIDPERSENTYQYKDKLKNQFKAKWISSVKSWGWFLGSNPQKIYDMFIKPCMEFLTSVENTPDGKKRDVIKIIDNMLADINNAEVVKNKTYIEDKLKSFKEELMNAVSADEFKKLMEPIIKFRKAQGHHFSFANSILIWIQDPNATLVKSKGRWEAMNRTIKPNSPSITMWIPYGTRPYSKEEKDAIKREFLRRERVSSEEKLSYGQKERLSVKLKGTNPRSYKLGPYFYDYRFTEQMEGKEDVVGNPNPDIQWYDDSGKETEDTIRLVDAICSVIQEEGVKLNYVDDLGGARGVSKSGEIDVLKDTPKNSGLVNTLAHEFSHELLHQTYLKSINKDLSEYFVGTKEGRGKVEQQAEISAWIIMKNFGYDMNTNINYVGIWGMNENNASEVFDSVTKVAERIIKKMNSKLNGMNESKINESFIPNGYELAKMLGAGKIYLKSKRNKKNVKKVKISEIRRLVYESFVQELNKKGLL